MKKGLFILCYIVFNSFICEAQPKINNERRIRLINKLDSMGMKHIVWGCLCCKHLNNSAFFKNDLLNDFYSNIEDSTLSNKSFMRRYKDMVDILDASMGITDTVCALPFFRRVDRMANIRYKESCKTVSYRIGNFFYCSEINIRYFSLLVSEFLIIRQTELARNEKLNSINLINKEDPEKNLSNEDYVYIYDCYRRYFSQTKRRKNKNVLEGSKYEWHIVIEKN